MNLAHAKRFAQEMRERQPMSTTEPSVAVLRVPRWWLNKDVKRVVTNA